MKIIILLILIHVCYSNVKTTTRRYQSKTIEESINTVIEDLRTHSVMLYSKTYCPYSIKLRRILSKFEIKDLKVVELDKVENMSEIQRFLKTLSGRSTVPQLYIVGKFIGGHDEIKAMDDDGKLLPMLEGGNN
ncbi:unnamed protein product [Auanema sp. JU1783]|nr:unnamed protein product [Auanema sp. JU1783]